MGFARRLGHRGFYGTLRLVVTRNRHGNYEVLATNDLSSDLTTIVQRKRHRWSVMPSSSAAWAPVSAMRIKLWGVMLPSLSSLLSSCSDSVCTRRNTG